MKTFRSIAYDTMGQLFTNNFQQLNSNVRHLAEHRVWDHVGSNLHFLSLLELDIKSRIKS